MKRTVPSPSAGGKRAIFVFALWLAGAGASAAQDYASGQAAYAARDWQTAEAIWTKEAAAGSAEAYLGLGNLLDFGLIGEADPDAAFSNYFRAARLGSAEAAFNVAVMLDSGVGTPPDSRAAAGWYSVAALDGFSRAEYNLGLMFASGDAIPANRRLAALWLQRAAPAIAAASARLDDVAPGAGAALSAPEPLLFFVIDRQDGPEARVAWAAAAGPEGARYRVEVMDAAAPGRPVILDVETEASAAAFPLNGDSSRFAWRVLQLTDRDYAGSSWRLADGSPLPAPPIAKVRFQTYSEDRRGQGYAERMGASLARSGALVTYSVADAPLDDSSVRYRYDSDAPLAASVSEFLPGLAGTGPTRSEGPELAPGEILVRLAFELAGD